MTNEVALEANRASHTNVKNEQTGPTLSSLALAIVHLPMYDAFAGASGNPADFPAYLTPGPVAGASKGVAVAAAAYTTLSELYPSEEPFFDSEVGPKIPTRLGHRSQDARPAPSLGSNCATVLAGGVPNPRLKERSGKTP